MNSQVRRVIERRRKGTFVLELSCGHVKKCKWRGKMEMHCTSCSIGMKPAPLAVLEPLAQKP